MPRRKHWFPVTHNINRDPEIMELTDTFGDWLLPAWLEILSMTDPNDGEWMGTPQKIAERLATLCLGLKRDKDQVRRRFKGTNAAYRAELALYWMTLKRWLCPILITDKGQIVQEWWPNHSRMVAEWSPNGTRMVGEWWPNRAQIIGFKVRNHAKYHRPRVPIRLPSYPILSEPTKKSHKNDSSKEAQAPFVLPDWIPEFEWKSYLEARKKMRKPLTARALSLAVSTLERLRDQGFDPAAVLDQSVMNGWTGLFPTKPMLVNAKGAYSNEPRSEQTEPKGFAGLREWRRLKGLDPK